ncbi:MAG: hypothetical protein ABJF04_22455 [Reichenbachiella sp.]|uniref:hypothetical protein n=1 Tax=Reichenbachiella sp. TaxID=2184521 RepID=UPI0032678B3E
MNEKHKHLGSRGSCFYILGFFGAAYYFISTSVGFWMGVGGFFKAIVWPVFFVYESFKYLGL